jgi:transcriptional regulator with XRE-family HTH domain
LAEINHDSFPKNTTSFWKEYVVIAESTTGTNQGQVIAQYRESRHWSQEELAKALNVATRTVQRMEKQEIVKSLSRRELLVAILGIPPVLLGLDASKKLVDQALEVFKADGSQDKLTFFQEELTTRWEMFHTGGIMDPGIWTAREA